MTSIGFVILVGCFWLCVWSRLDSYSQWQKRKVTELLEGDPPWTSFQHYLLIGVMIGLVLLVVGIGTWLWEVMP